MPVPLHHKVSKLGNFSIPAKLVMSLLLETLIVVILAISAADNVSLLSGLIPVLSFKYLLNATSGKFVALISTSSRAYGVGIAPLDNGLFSIGAGAGSSFNVSTVTESLTST